MHLVAEIIFIFLIVYLTGSSSKWQKKTAFLYSFAPGYVTDCILSTLILIGHAITSYNE